MNCPKDGAVLERVRVEALGLELDKCHQCDGIWCDPGELERLHSSELDGVEEIIERKYGNPEPLRGRTKGYMRCPRCGEQGRLLRYHYTYLQPVVIDRCNRCHGVWLDDTELDAILTEVKQLDGADTRSKFAGLVYAVMSWVGRT